MGELTKTSAAPAIMGGDMVERYINFIDRGESTTRTYIINLRQFAAWLKYKGITAPNRDDIIAFREYLGSEHEAIILNREAPEGWSYRTDKKGNRLKVTCRANTIKQYVATVKQFFRWTASEGLYPNIADNVHTPRIKQDGHRKEALTARDVVKIEKAIEKNAEQKKEKAAGHQKDTAGRIRRAEEQEKRLLAMYLLTVNAGLRTIEINRANVGDIETINGTAYLYIWGKGHAEADTKKPLAREVKEAIDEYLAIREDNPTKASPLFVSTGNRSGGKRIATTTISTMLKRALQAAGYDSERITAHSLRHTAGTNAQEISGDLYLTQQYMRHKSPTTTEIYLHTETEQKETDLAQRLYDHYHGRDREEDNRQALESIIENMSAEQIKQLATMARAIA